MAANGPEFTQLWSTLFMSMHLPGAESANGVLGAELLSQEAKADDLTGDYLDANLLDHQHPVFGWLKQCIERGVVDYARKAGVTADLAFSLQAWANVNMPGDYHNLHNHPHSWLSGTYYVQVPRGTDTGHRTDLNSNAISFFDPRAQANMGAISGDGQFDPEHRIDPVAGQLLIWPAFLHHLVHPNLSDGTRISISFNVVLKWRDAYLQP